MDVPKKPTYLEFLKGAVGGTALAIFWVLPSVAAINFNQPSLFQRFGAMGIIWVILVFTFERRRIAEIEEIAYEPNFKTKIEEQSSHFSSVSAEISEIEVKIQNLLSIENLQDNPTVTEVEELKRRTQELRSYVSELQATLLERSRLIPQARNIVVGVTWFEMLVVILATLQSGFGDWFVCSVNHGSLSTC